MRPGVAAVLAVALMVFAAAQAAGGSTQGLHLTPHSTTAQRPAAADTLAPLSPGSAFRLKAMIERETGEPQIEGTEWKRRKDPRVAMLCALAVPGLGQIYNEKPLKALIAGGVEIFYLSRILHYYRLEKREEKLRDRYPRYITEQTADGPVTFQNPEWTAHDWYVREYSERQIDWVWWSAGAILVVVLDAYIDAYLHDMNFRIESSPLEDSAGLSLVIDF